MPTGPAARPVRPTIVGEAPVAERRLVSILFADLVGFTTLAEGRDPEETRELLSRYFDLSRDVIGRYGGTRHRPTRMTPSAQFGQPSSFLTPFEPSARRSRPGPGS
jgi:adenylate cyclase